MGRESMISLMVIVMMVTFRMARGKEGEPTFGGTETDTMDIGNMIRWREMAKS